MKPKIAIVVGFVIAALAIVMFVKRDHGSSSTAVGSATPTETPKPGTQTEIPFVYSTEKQAWIEAVVADFAKQHPEIKVTLVGKGSLDAAQDILDGKLQPALWSPADSMAVNLL